MLRKDLENLAYHNWYDAPATTKEECSQTLRELLLGHAQAVMFSILRKNDEALANEAVNHVMLNLDSFKGEAQFTSWAHRVLMSVMYDQRRLDRKRKEVSMDVPGFDLPSDDSIESRDLLMTVKKLLTPEDYTVFQHIVILGENHDEASSELRIPKSTITRMWARIKGTLQHEFAQ